jgi:pimeloyl-ACP methyl ester carboxylesterase
MSSDRQEARMARVDELADAERRIFDRYGIAPERRVLRLADPPLEVHALEHGSGAPVLLVHGSGMSAATWAPVLAELPDRRAIAFDLPGFGRSAPYSYTGRPLREHAVAQLSSVLDALGLERAAIAGTSLGGMWGLAMAMTKPERVSAVISLGMPAVAFPGVRRDPFFTILTTPVLGRLAKHAPTPKSARAARKAMAKVLGERALERTPDEYFDVVRLGMAQPAWPAAMRTHLNLALRVGRPRPENAFTDDELRSITTPVWQLWGDGDVYGGPDIGRRAAELMPNARIEVIRGGHAPFLDDPGRCAELIREATATVNSA